MNYIRRVLIEEIYGRLSKRFHMRIKVDKTLTYAAQVLCSPNRRLGWPVQMSRLPAFRHLNVLLT
jgi:hypothetical protein